MLTLGVTGGIGSGKSTVAKFFVDRGAALFDADAEAKHILLNHDGVRSKVKASFGPDLLDDRGEIDFTHLAAVSFASSRQQKRLNAIIHPEVIRAANRARDGARQRALAIFVLDVPLLFEAQMERDLDLTLAVMVAESIRFERVLSRGNLTEADLRRRAKLQLSDEERAARADLVVDNNGTVQELYAQLEKIYASFRRARKS